MDNKALQGHILSIYKEIKKLCEKHNIRYYAIGGTCIGAARHKGFIPWDDDLDIAMPLNDYNRFFEIASKELPDNLRVFKGTEMRHSGSLFMKVDDSNTTFIESEVTYYPDEYRGVFVDIMPLNGIPSGKNKQKKYAFIVSLLVRLNVKRRTRYSNNKHFKNRLLWIVCLPFKLIVPHNFWSRLWCKYTEKYDFEKSEYTGYTWFGRIKRLIFKKEWFSDYVELPFEDTTMRCPVGYDEYLTQQFGNYMEIPPEADREVHSIDGIVDLDKPYSCYQEKYRSERAKK